MPYNRKTLEALFSRELSIDPLSKLFVAVSGGCDSMALLELSNRYHKDVEALHVNYKLRGEESELDVQCVRAFCSVNDIPYHVLNIDLAKKIEKEGGNLQNQARNVRYDFFDQYLSKHKGSKLALAHHQDDQIETFWLQMSRGGGLRAMSGMAGSRGGYIRPFIGIPKQSIEAYAKESGLTWREDASNQKDIYARNIWRNVLIPELNKNIPGLNESVLLLQGVFQNQLKEDELLCKRYKVKSGKSFLLKTDDILNFTSNQWIEFLYQLKIPLSMAEPLIRLFLAETGKKVPVSEGESLYSHVWREKNGVFFESRLDAKTTPRTEIQITRVERLPGKFSKTEVFIDESKIEGDISLRKWRTGDRIHPIGVPGSKLVSDILKDAKVPLRNKSECLVLTDQKKLLAIPGYCIDRRAIAKSAPALKISFDTHFEKPPTL